MEKTMTISDAIARLLKHRGIDKLFMLTGGDQALWVSFKKHNISMYLARSEKSAAYMADGYSRASGRACVAYGQSGPGATNLAAGIVEPFWAMSPVLAFTSDTEDGTKYKYNYQDIEQLPMFTPTTKWNIKVFRLDRTVDLFHQAILSTMTPPRGPAHISVPRDYFTREVEVEDRWLQEFNTDYMEQAIKPEAQQVEQLLDLLNRAQKPVILAGGGSVSSQAGAQVLALAELLQLPVVTSLNGKGVIPESHPLAVGVCGRYSRKVANDIVTSADCVLVIGSRLGGLTTNNYKAPRQDATIIRLDLTPQTFNVNYKEELSLIADAKAGLQQIIEAAKKRSLKKHNDWAQEVANAVKQWRVSFESAAISAEGKPLKQYTVLKHINKLKEIADISVVADTGYASAWAGALFEAEEPKTFFRALGSLGWSFPASLGVQLAQPERRVICVTGDGGMGYHIADLETALRLQLPVVVVVFNNSMLSFEYHLQKYYFDNNIIHEANDFKETNFAEIARSFGATGIRVNTEEELRNALRSAVKNDVLTVVDVVVDKECYAPVTVYEKAEKRSI